MCLPLRIATENSLVGSELIFRKISGRSDRGANYYLRFNIKLFGECCREAFPVDTPQSFRVYSEQRSSFSSHSSLITEAVPIRSAPFFHLFHEINGVTPESLIQENPQVT